MMGLMLPREINIHCSLMSLHEMFRLASFVFGAPVTPFSDHDLSSPLKLNDGSSNRFVGDASVSQVSDILKIFIPLFYICLFSKSSLWAPNMLRPLRCAR